MAKALFAGGHAGKAETSRAWGCEQNQIASLVGEEVKPAGGEGEAGCFASQAVMSQG